LIDKKIIQKLKYNSILQGKKKEDLTATNLKIWKNIVKSKLWSYRSLP